MDHLYQTTMLLPASYAVISEEEMTYLDGGKEILLGNVFGYDITFNTDQFVIFCQSALVNALLLGGSYSLSYFKNTIVSGANNGLSPAGTFYHTWDKMNGWSKLALFGMGTSGRLLCIRSGRKPYPYGQEHLQRPCEPHACFQQRTGF